MLPGTLLTLMIGPTVAVPAMPSLMEALQSVQVTHSDEGRSGFQITFRAGRSGPADLLDYSLLSNPSLRSFSRVILVVTFNAIPGVLMDGIITNQQFAPGSNPGTSTLTITGEDVSVMMDMEEKVVEHPAQNEMIIANKIIASYAQYGLIPMVIPPPSIDFPNPVQRTPVQRDTDLKYLQNMAEKHGYVFYIAPGPAPFANTAYWGPPVRTGLPQKALSVNLGGDSNVNSISFRNNSLSPTLVSGKVKDSLTGQELPVQTFFSTRTPLASQPALLFNQPNVRRSLLKETDGISYLQAMARAQGITDRSTDEVVTATGELDALRYGGLLEPRGLVGVRGVGYSYDGLYYVKNVTHSIKKGEYKQSFTLTREGVGALTPMVRP